MKTPNKLLTLCMALSLTLTMIFALQGKYRAFSGADLNPKELSALGEARNRGEAVAAAYIDECNTVHPGAIRKEAIEYMITENGLFTSYIEEFRNKGYISSDFQNSYNKTSAKTQPSEPAKTPEPFTVEAYNPSKAMWTTQNVNCREGASTEYNKVGSLKEHEQVNVTGVASTGWYQITKEDGAVVYVSNKYLTEEAPTTQTIYQYDEKDGVVETITVTGENVEDVDKVVAEITATPEPTIEPTPEPTVEPTPVPTPEPTAEPVIEEPAENGINMWYVAGAAFALVVLIVGIVMVARKKK